MNKTTNVLILHCYNIANICKYVPTAVLEARYAHGAMRGRPASYNFMA